MSVAPSSIVPPSGKDHWPTAEASSLSESSGVLEIIRKDVHNFSQYERQYQEVLMSLEQEDILEGFRNEYIGLHHSFVKSHDGESRLLKKCIELQNDIFSCAAKAQAAEELAAGDRQTIDSLRTEIDKSQKKCAATKEREANLREKISGLKREILELERLAHEPVEVPAQEAALQNLMRVHESIMKERENQQYLLTAVQHDIDYIERSLLKLKEGKKSNDIEMRVVKDAIDEKKHEIDMVNALKARTEESLRGKREELTRRNTYYSDRQRTVERLKDENRAQGEDIRRLNEEKEALSTQHQQLTRQIQTVNSSLQECNEDNDAFQKKIKEATDELRLYESEVEAANKMYIKESKILEALGRRNILAQRKQAELEQKRENLHEALVRNEQELEKLRQLSEKENLELQSLNKERDILHEQFLSAEGKAQRNASWLAEKKIQFHHLEHEVVVCEESAQKQNEDIFKLTKECSMYEEKAKNSALKCATLLANVQSREALVEEAQNKVSEVEVRLKQQQELLDVVVTDRNTYAKHLAQLRNDAVEMGKKFKVILIQIKQVKEEIVRRERELILEEENIGVLGKEKKEIENHIISLQRCADKKLRTVEQYNTEIKKLVDIAGEASEEVTRQRRKCRDIVNERDLLGVRVIKRNEELNALYEKIKTQQALMQRHEAIYNDLTKSIEELQYQATQLVQQLQKLKEFTKRLPELRLLVNNATRELNREKVHVQELLDESKRPVNLHPNHALSWSEPETFALSEKLRHLQKELVERRETLEKTEQLIQQKETSYMQSKSALAKHPGPEVAEQIVAYQNGLVKKQGQLKMMQENLKFFREQTEMYRGRHDELRERLALMAKEYALIRQQQEKTNTANYYNTTGTDHTPEDDDSPPTYLGYVAQPRPQESSLKPNDAPQ